MSITIDDLVGAGPPILPEISLYRTRAPSGPGLTYGPDGSVLTFDLMSSETPTDSVSVSEFAIEDGSKTTDHSRKEPGKVSFTMHVANRNTGFIQDRDFLAYETLLQILETREPITIVTRLRVYQDWLLISVAPTRTGDTGQVLDVTINLREMEFGESEVVQVPASILAAIPKKNGGKKSGKDLGSATGVGCQGTSPAAESESQTTAGPVYADGSGACITADSARRIGKPPTGEIWEDENGVIHTTPVPGPASTSERDKAASPKEKAARKDAAKLDAANNPARGDQSRDRRAKTYAYYTDPT